MVERATHTTKFCDFGLGKLKSAHSPSQTLTTSIPATPAYMAPECHVEKKKATIQYDVWSLGCTLIKLVMERDCWEDLLDNKEPTVEMESDVAIVSVLVDVIKAKAFPSLLQSLPFDVPFNVEATSEGLFPVRQ